MSPSRAGRRVLVAEVTGDARGRIQRWRERHDPEQAQRLPPHATLCYWPPILPPEGLPVLERQVRHAFHRPVEAWLGEVHELQNPDGTFYVSVERTAALDEARRRLFDGTHVALDGRSDFSWHVTCVRYGRQRSPEGREALRRAATELCIGAQWRVDIVAYLELQGDRYEPVAVWRV